MRRSLILSVAVATSFVLGVVTSGVGSESLEDVPPLTDRSSVVKFEPGQTFPVSGPDGEVITCDDGKTLRMDPIRDDPPPGLIEVRPTDDPSVEETVDGAVPRCGADGGEGEPAWIPEHLAEKYPTTAPERFETETPSP